MKQESPESKQGECSIDQANLTGIIVKAMGYTDSDPETSLMYARKSAEGICTRVFSREIGNPGNNRLDKLIELLSNKDCLPERIKIPLRVIQQYGNCATLRSSLAIQPQRTIFMAGRHIASLKRHEKLSANPSTQKRKTSVLLRGRPRPLTSKKLLSAIE